MSIHKVTLLPSRHQFLTSPKQSLLHAGLESGLNLKYGCDVGNCGECLVRLITGNLHRIKHSDFSLTLAQKNNQNYLSCCFAAASDIQIEAAEIDSVTEIPEQLIQAKIYKMELLKDSVMSVFVKTPRSQPLQFFAGQYVTLTLTDGLSRNKSIASCPCDGLKPEFHIKRRENDAFSEFVFNQLKKNDSIKINGPWGNFVMDDESSRALVLIAFDTGFASIKSLIEHAIALEKEQPIKFYWLITPGNHAYMEKYCQSIADALDNFSYQPIFITERHTEEVANVMNQVIKIETTIRHSDVYVTLPEESHSTITQMFNSSGMDERHWRIDTVKQI